MENFLWISEHVRVEWRCDVFGPRDIWDIFLDLGYFFGFGIFFWICDIFLDLGYFLGFGIYFEEFSLGFQTCAGRVVV